MNCCVGLSPAERCAWCKRSAEAYADLVNRVQHISIPLSDSPQDPNHIDVWVSSNPGARYGMTDAEWDRYSQDPRVLAQIGSCQAVHAWVLATWQRDKARGISPALARIAAAPAPRVDADGWEVE